MGAYLARHHPGDASMEPDPLQMPIFPLDYGFPNQKECVMVVTQQISNVQLSLEQREYCAHHLIWLLKCKCNSFPNFLASKHKRHAWDYCEHLDYVQQMKEFKRERQLLQRKKPQEQREAWAAQGQGSQVAREVVL